MRRAQPLAFPKALDLLRNTLKHSPADSTEIAWTEVVHQTACNQQESVNPAPGPIARCTLQIRVVEQGRTGSYTTGALEAAELHSAVRQALARAALSSGTDRDDASGPSAVSAVSSGGHPPESPDDTPPTGAASASEPTVSSVSPVSSDALFDERIARLSPQEAQDLLHQGLRPEAEHGTLEWSVGRTAVLHSAGLERWTTTTCAQLRITSGDGFAAGQAATAARTFQRLDPPGTLERARGRRAATTDPGETDTETAAAPSLYLAPEATAELLLHLRRLARATLAFPDAHPAARPDFPGTPLDAALHLVDDPLDPAGLPFPFDLRGAPLVAQPLLVGGTAQPLPPNATAEDPRGSHLILHPGTLTEDALLERCEGGLFGTRIARIQCLDPARLELRCTLQGVRRIRGGRPAEVLPPTPVVIPLLWSLQSVLGVGATAVTLAEGDGLFGGARAPALALPLRP